MAGLRNSMYYKDAPSPDIFVAGLCIRKKKDKEIFSRLPLYDPEDYEVLLKYQSGAHATQQYWEITCTGLKAGRDPQKAIIQDMFAWTKSLAGKTTSTQPIGVRSKRAVFLSIHGGSGTSKSSNALKFGSPSVVLCYILPTTHRASSVIDSYPDEPSKYPAFKCLKTVLRGMRSGDFIVHPFTMEMLSSLDNWLRERHSIPDTVNHLFTQNLNQRLQQYCINPTYRSENKPPVLNLVDSFISSSHLFQGLAASTNSFSLPVPSLNKNEDTADYNENQEESAPADRFVVNMYFGKKPRQLGKVNIFVVNEHFGKGIPNYDAIRKSPSTAQIKEMPSDFPLHRYAISANVDGVRTTASSGLSVNDKDEESWTPLHYACWCGHMDIAKLLVTELQADVRVKDRVGFTPLHAAAKNGHANIVSFLLTQPGIDPNVTDREDKTPLQLCLDNKQNDWESVVDMLKDAHPIPSQSESAPSKAVRLRVDFTSGGHQIVTLPEGQNTTSSTILKEIYNNIELSPNFYAVFNLWIVSESVELLLGNNDKPLVVLNKNWHHIVNDLSLHTVETPVVFLRRNVHYPVEKEKQITDPIALKYLFSDAYRHVLNSYYPCSEDAAIYLAGILLSITHGDYNKALHTTDFLKDKLTQLIPRAMINAKKKNDYIKRILSQYEGISQEDIPDRMALHLKYVKYCWQWQYYGAIFFPATIKPQTVLGRSVSIRLGINHMGFHIVSAEENVLSETVGFEGTHWSFSTERKEITLKVQGSESSTVIKSKYIQIIQKIVQKIDEKKKENSS
ncbi:krev interaction trapped protein 1-like [Dysidea avara]|uniref:krev interaction trapped protein 1-like n=1 Tax=Dysidea avara TaxID=196820 RepID=UPI00331A9840